jgi:hypothetical protein
LLEERPFSSPIEEKIMKIQKIMMVLVAMAISAMLPFKVLAENQADNQLKLWVTPKYEIAKTDQGGTEERLMLDVFGRRGSWGAGLELFNSRTSDFTSIRPVVSHSWSNWALTGAFDVNSLGGQHFSLGGAWFDQLGPLAVYGSLTYFLSTSQCAEDLVDGYVDVKAAFPIPFLDKRGTIGLELFDDYYLDSQEHWVYVRPYLEVPVREGVSMRVTPYRNWRGEEKIEDGIRFQFTLSL